MVRSFPVVTVALLVLVPNLALGQGRAHDGLVAKHAAAYGVPESLVRRVIHIESKGNPRAISKGNYGLMQIRLGTARAMGYRGGAEGLLDADMNMTYAVKYLAGAYRAARGNHQRAIRYYQSGYYYQAKAQGFSPYTLASNAQQPVTQQAAAPDPAMVQQELVRQQTVEQQQARIAQRQAMLQQRIEQQQQQQQARIAQRQAMLQQQAEREQARRQQAIERQQARQQQRIEQQRARSVQAAPRGAEPASNYAWYNPMRYFKHPTHQAYPYKPVQR